MNIMNDDDKNEWLEKICIYIKRNINENLTN